MPIDFSPYITLTPLNVEPGDIYQRSIDVAMTVLPEFNLRRGTLEDAMFQAASYMNALNVATINSLPSRLMEGFANLIGYSRFEGTRSTITLTVNAFDQSGGVVPKGTIFSHRITESDGSVSEYTYETAEEVDLAPLWSSATTYATDDCVTYNSATYRSLQNSNTNRNPATQTAYWDAIGTGDDPPFASIPVISKVVGYTPTISENDELICITTNNVVDSAFAQDDFAIGLDGDADSTYLSGARTHIASMSNSLSTSRQMQSAIITDYRVVQICKVYDLTDSADMAISAADAPGFVTVCVYGKDRTLTTQELTSIDTYVTNKSVPGLEISIQNVTFAPFTISIALTHRSTTESSYVENAVKQVLANALSYLNFPLTKTTIESNYLSSIVYNSVGSIISITSCTMTHTGSDFSETINVAQTLLSFVEKGVLPLVTTSNITVTATPVDI
mgnify:CR=1 FL=1